MKRNRIVAAVAGIGVVVFLIRGHSWIGSTDTDVDSATAAPQSTEGSERCAPNRPAHASGDIPLAADTDRTSTVRTRGEAHPSQPAAGWDGTNTAADSRPQEFDERIAGYRERLQALQDQMGPLRDDPVRRQELARNPFPALDELDDAALLQMLRKDNATFTEAAVRGQEIGKDIAPNEWMTWFEEAGPYGGLRGQVTMAMLNSVVIRATMNPRKSQSLDCVRILSLLDGYLRAWQDEPVDTSAVNQLTGTLQRLAPVSGGLELIRRWLVETPHGNEIVEKGLYATLVYWPFNDAAPLAREALLTLRGGAIKGAIECWGQAKRRTLNPAWTEDDVRSLLPTLVDCVKRTPSAAAILLSSALAGKDLFLDYCIEIGAALLERTDSRACAAMGFHFYSHVDLSLACATWRDWFNSHDEHQVAVACIAAPHLRDHVITDTERDRIMALAMDENREAGARASAAEALCQVEKGFIRSRQVVLSWVVRPSLAEPMLRALGRMVAMGTKAVVEATLQEVIDDVSKTPPERHYTLFLLATRNPEAALAICEQQATATPRLFETVTLLLAAATVEAMLPDQTYKRTAAVRAAIGEPEPKWITELRLRRDNTSPEGRVVTYAWSSAPTRK